ncbi:UDP-glucose/GDP-mannose dehydrogenase family protein [Noviherbaspirillum cavernae]|uniref:UDP-glucose 6-dehydrogenase n=1 Tax=Noviherbaspirillum cavernae TaxID=2320862 RepID=A0A418X3M5_9BURK|nr:UDP-glucose/GDP-mannose dehydrogenase family protein [Noviherbaspirillum cavernae]RJG07036.1 UDP-glucose/GDP-mannose dehydrogenase family protein [Noviherbaspirillum cavernae]
MKITIFGTGYVGLVTGACFAEAGYQVMCVDIDKEKIERLKQGIIPIYEPGLDRVVKENYAAQRLHFSTSAGEGVAFGEFQFIAVGTPPDEDGSADLKYVLAVAEEIGRHMEQHRIVIDKSTVPVGTADKVRAKISSVLAERKVDLTFDVISNPEFLKEGSAVADFMKPDRIVIGADSPANAERMRELYAPFNRNHDRLIVMDIRSAELTKYAANAMLATKISFMNEISNLAERLGADVENVRIGIGSDPRIGYQFIYAGCGYGGSCFPKDVQALARTASTIGYEPRLLNAIEAINQDQKTRLFELVSRHFDGAGNLRGKVFALWGLAFKPNTDDMREAPSRVLMEALWAAGARVQAYDPEAMEETQRIYGAREDLVLMGTKEAALKGADGLVICTEWKGFTAPDFAVMAQQLKQPVIFDGRNLYDPSRLQAKGWTYYGIGRGASCKRDN